MSVHCTRDYAKLECDRCPKSEWFEDLPAGLTAGWAEVNDGKAYGVPVGVAHLCPGCAEVAWANREPVEP